MVILKGGLEPFIKYIKAHATTGTLALCYDGEQAQMPVKSVSFGCIDNSGEQAYKLFNSLREIDGMPEVQVVFARCPAAQGLGLAVYNRLLRAASFEVIEL